MLINSSIYDLAGSIIDGQLVESAFTPATYPYRHVVVAGSFEMSFPNSSVLGDNVMIGDVFPWKDYAASSFRVASREDNSIYYCIIPSTNETLINTSIELSQGQTATLDVCQLGFIFGPEFTVNSVTKNNVAVIACEDNPAHIVASQPCKLVKLYSSFYKF